MSNKIIKAMESHIEQEESDSSRQSADLRIRKTQVEKLETFEFFFKFKIDVF